jgi:hypothetical protein
VEVARAADRSESVDLEEYQRAIWLWQRRSSEVSTIVHLLIFGVGALIHIPLILGDDFVIFAIYHAFYICVVTVCVGRFLWLESRYRRGSRITFVPLPGWQATAIPAAKASDVSRD